MSVFITGGAGFLGAHVVRAALADPRLAEHTIVVLDDLSGGSQENLPRDSRVHLVRGSVTDERLVDDLCRQHRFRYLYHLAAYAAEGLSHFIRRFNYTSNVLGSVTLINAAVRYDVECFVFTSSIAVYGSNQVPMSETMVPRPEDPYGIAKYAVELDLEAAARLFGLNYVVFRPHNVYGEYQNLGDPYRNVIGIFLCRLLQGQPMPIFGDGTQQRAFTYVGDIAPVITGAPLVPAARNQVFNIGARQVTSINELATRVANAVKVPARSEHLPARHEVKTAYSDPAKCDQVFGRLVDTPLEVGLERMAAWARQTHIRSSRLKMPIEVSRNLPGVWKERMKDEG